ncbi:hypothetical protein [Hymenobacter bucti]|uniref:Uncharacterized protein n=1 Tax=Hymenobacter bucti TaxID=1844114 RepID=A0ABW4QWL5_9BACT
MFYHFADLFFQGRSVRLIRPDFGQPAINKDLADVARLARLENKDRAVFILGPYGSHDSFNTFRNQAEHDFWLSFAKENDISHGAYDWVRSWADLPGEEPATGGETDRGQK